MRPYILVVFSLIFTSVNAADVYQWVDAQGVEHFSDTPPPADQDGVKLLKVNGQDINLFHDEAAESAVAASVPVPGPKPQAARVPRNDDECAAIYGNPCDWDNQWQAYAVVNCQRVNDPNCDDAAHLQAHYDPRVQARHAAAAGGRR